LPESHRPASAQSALGVGSKNGEPSGRQGGRGSLAGSGRRRVELGEQEGREASYGQGSCRSFAGFTLVLNQPLPARQLRLGPGLIDWGIPYSGSQFSIGFAFSLRRCAAGSSLIFEPLWSGSLGRVLEVATFDRWVPQPFLLRCFACSEGLKLKEINHLRRTTDRSHYSALSRTCGARISPRFPAHLCA
jgi:hypothetical protein